MQDFDRRGGGMLAWDPLRVLYYIKMAFLAGFFPTNSDTCSVNVAIYEGEGGQDRTSSSENLTVVEAAKPRRPHLE